MTSSAEVLAELRQAREEGAIPARQAELFSRALRLSIDEGRPLDALNQRIGDERERFLSLVAQGAEGHWYWMGPQYFRLNSGRSRKPKRYAFELESGPLSGSKDIVDRRCSEPRCIAPAHHVLVPWSEWRRRYSDDFLLGRLRVVALRLGYSPTMNKWRRLRMSPDRRSFTDRFGSWDEALRKAGLPLPQRRERETPERCREALLSFAEHLGRAPSSHDVDENPEWFRSRGYAVSAWTYANRLGSGTWVSAIEAAGLAPEQGETE